MKGFFYKKESLLLVLGFFVSFQVNAVNSNNQLASSLPLDGLSPANFTEIAKSVRLNNDTDIPAEISYLFADVKFDPAHNALKFLEFGQAKNGGFRTWDAIFNTGEIWENFWGYLATHRLPMMYVGALPSNAIINKIGLTLQEKVSWDTFARVGGKGFSSLYDLERSPFFKSVIQQKKAFDSRDIQSYKGILVFKYRDDRELTHYNALESFKKRHPDVLVLDDSSRPYAANKELFNLVFDEEDLLKYRPKAGTFDKIYSPRVVNEIKSSFDANLFVIKPVNSGMSNGVVVVSRDMLDKSIKRISREVATVHADGFNYRPVDTVTWDYWKGDRNKKFLVEEYVESKLIQVGDDMYDPTMRVIFALQHDKGEIKWELLASWWKLPANPIDADCTFTEKCVSKFRSDLKELSRKHLTVSSDDLVVLRNLLDDVLPKVYCKMLKVRKEMKRRAGA